MALEHAHCSTIWHDLFCSRVPKFRFACAVASKNTAYLQTVHNSFGRIHLADLFGHANSLVMCRWLVDHAAAQCVHSEDNYALRQAARVGDLRLCQWLVDTFEFTRQDAQSLDNEAFRLAVFHGHWAVARWLVDHFRLTHRDAGAHGGYALKWAIHNGHFAVARWLSATFWSSTFKQQSINKYFPKRCKQC